MSVKVKRLEWDYLNDWWAKAYTDFGVYEATAELEGAFAKFTSTAGKVLWLDVGRYARELRTAKRVCQNHYNKLVKEGEGNE